MQTPPGEEEPELWTMTDAANHSGLSRQRVHWLTRHDPNWPKVAAQVGRYRAYRKADVVRYFAERVTRQGQRTDLERRRGGQGPG